MELTRYLRIMHNYWDRTRILWATQILLNTFSSDDDFKELEKWLSKKELDQLNNKGSEGLRKVFTCMIFLLPISIYTDTFATDKPFWIYSLLTMLTLLLNTIICSFVLKYNPSYFKILIPINIVLYMMATTQVNTSLVEYRVLEYMLANVSFFWLQIVISPTQWKSNWAAFTVTSIYFIYALQKHFGEVVAELYIGMFFTVFLFNWFWYISYQKNKGFLSIILKNERLIAEIKKIIEAFPHGVLIQSGDIWYTNDEFDKSLKIINAKIDSLNSVVAWIGEESKSDQPGNIGSPSEDAQSSLAKLLESQESKLRNWDVVEKQTVTLKIPNELIEDNDDDEELLPRDSDSDNSECLERNCNIKSMKVHWNGVPSYMHVFIDTSGIRRLEKANNSIRWQKIMFTSVSHEFRTPLNAIINSCRFVEQLFDQAIKEKSQDQIERHSETIRKFISIGKHSSELLLSLVEDVLNLSKMESNMFTVTPSDFCLKDLVGEVIELFEAQCARKGINLVVNVSRSMGELEIKSDRQRIKQTLINLMSNAFKFTFQGSIELKISATESEEDQLMEFSVADTGVGISESDQSKLFKLFGMLSNTKNINPNGCGIGLTVSRKYVESLGGKFEVESELDKGTKMTFIIPLHIVSSVPDTDQRSDENDLSVKIANAPITIESLSVEPKLNIVANMSHLHENFDEEKLSSAINYSKISYASQSKMNL